MNINIEDGKLYAFVGPEGCGKTTVLEIFMGTKKPDLGKVSRMGDYKYPSLQTAYVPQKDTLNPKKNAIWNVKKAHRTISKGSASQELLKFLSQDKITCPVNDLKESERRIVETVKAMLTPADFVVLDEPFRGMTEDESKKVLEYILNRLGSRPLLLAQREDPKLKGFRVIHL
ncbi:MAG: ATP-binding cassette domain-containing protein [Lachnospiraceae bacterium]|nr:ATP-binding cassette domain-containing protein [Lachnospiraceae bacterium]